MRISLASKLNIMGYFDSTTYQAWSGGKMEENERLELEITTPFKIKSKEMLSSTGIAIAK